MKKHTKTKDGYTNFAAYTNEFKVSIAFLHNVKGVTTSSIVKDYGISEASVRKWSKIYSEYFYNEAQIDEKSKYDRLLTVIASQSNGECQKVYEDDKQLILFCTAEKDNLQKSIETLGLKTKSLDKVDIYRIKGTFIILNKNSLPLKRFLMSSADMSPQEAEKQKSDFDVCKTESCLNGLCETLEFYSKEEENVENQSDEEIVDNNTEEKHNTIKTECPTTTDSVIENSIRILKTDTGSQIEDKLYSIFCKIFAETSRTGFELQYFELGTNSSFHNGNEISSITGDRYSVYYRDDVDDFHISGFINFIDCGNIWIIDDAGNKIFSKFFLFARNKMKLPYAITCIYSNKTGNILAIEKDRGIDEDVLFSSEFKIFSNGETNAAELMKQEEETGQETENCEEPDILEPFVAAPQEHPPIISTSNNVGSEKIRKIMILKACLAKNKIKIFKNNIDIEDFGFIFMIKKGLYNLRWTSDKIYRILSDAGFEDATVVLQYIYEHKKYFFHINIPFDRKTEINLPENPFEL